MLTTPAKARGIKNLSLEFNQANGTKPDFPKCSSRMQQIEMSRQLRRRNSPRHCESAFQQRPIKRFSVECHQYGPFGKSLREFAKDGVFIRKVAHEELLDLQAARIPPCDAGQERVSSRSSSKASCFRI